jgi:hypothetical protein
MSEYFLGNYSEIGESLRGIQESELGASAQQLSALRGQMGRFAGHAPVSKVMRSPYKDSTQIGVKCMGTFAPTSWDSTTLPVVSGQTRVYKSFKPTKAIVTELVTATFTQQNQPNVVLSASIPDGSDLVLVSAFSGADNCFPNAPSESNGIAGVAFANNSLGNGISWPTINGGIDMSVQFAIEPTALSRIATPAGYTLASLFVSVRFNLLGPSLR